MTWRIRIRKMLRLRRREKRCGSNIDAYRFGYLLGRAISRRRNITLDRESSTVRR